VAISGGSFLGTAAYALMLSCSLFLIPFMFITSPELILRGDIGLIILALVTALIGVFFLSIAAVGQARGSVSPVPRLLMAAGAITLIIPGLTTDLIGAAAAGLGLLAHLRREVARRLVLRWR